MLRSTELSALDSKDGMAIFDVQQGKLLINSSHPFVAAFQEFFTDARRSLPLEMFAMSEIFMEANLYYTGLDESVIRDAIGRRDELLRHFVRTSARRTAGMIALALTEARDDRNKLEEEMRATFEAMGFANVIHIGEKGTPDGTAEAHLAATEDGIVQRYKVGLEAKSGGSVSAHRLNISGIARHMEDYNCDHHIVIGNGFATSTGDDSASVREINNHKESTGKTITLMHIDDLARLVRNVSAKRVGGLSRIRNLFRNCVTPEQSKEWVDNLAAETPENWPHMEILETVWYLAEEQPNEAMKAMADLESLDKRCLGMVRRYVWDMDKVMKECSRVLKRKGRAVFVVGNSAIRGVFIKNSEAFIRLADSNNLSLVSHSTRPIETKRRYLPPPESERAGGKMQGRMREEVILEFRAD